MLDNKNNQSLHNLRIILSKQGKFKEAEEINKKINET